MIFWNLRQFWNITSSVYARYHVQIMLLFVHTTTRKRFVIFTCRYFKLSWNTTVLSQSNSWNFSCTSIIVVIVMISIGNSMICTDIWHKYHEWYFEIVIQVYRRVKFETILKDHEWILCQISRTNHAISCPYYYPQKVCNFVM